MKTETLLWIILGIIAIISLLEIGTLYLTSDEVKCNWLWCEFSSTLSESHRECFENGVQVPCENIDEVMDKIEDYYER